ncbi:hypothetical protein VTN49DRAFT_6823 [Thermomyces lanuginosus]|uniref:uncharacterized protein n=1 Tax=Thermomyces lanuginosus TaxID=5541 RepID=UPI0037423776
MASQAHFAVPFGRNQCFVGRESIIERLLSLISPSVRGEADDCQRTAIVGLGGVGKTQIALEAAIRVRERHPDCSIFWVPAVDSSSFENAFRTIGQLLKVDGINEQDADARTLVKTALNESTDSWLLIIDNADNIDLLLDDETGLIERLPSSRNGHILFTSRNREVVSRLGIPEANVLTIEEMNEDEALELLRKHLDASQMHDEERTKKLIECLGYLPLALRQASAYMTKKQISTSEYLDHCQSSDRDMVELLSKDFEDPHRYKERENPIATTWLISFREIEDHYPLAADYLKFMAFLSQKDIPQALFPSDSKEKLEEAIGALKAYAFLSEREDRSTYDMHRLVQLATLNWLTEKGSANEWSTRVLQRLAEIFPFPEHENRDVWMGYLPHARRVLEFEKIINDQVALGDLLEKIGLSLRQLGQYREIETLQRRSLEIMEKALGPEHPDALDSANNLAAALFDLGKYEEAEEIHQRVLRTREKVQGSEHPRTVSSVKNLGLVLHCLGRYDEAEAMNRRALDIEEKVLGPEHPDTLRTVSNLASVLADMGKYEEAEAMQRRALALKEKVLGPDHPETLSSINSLALILSGLSKYEEAEVLHRRALEVRQKILGSEHPDTLTNIDCLGTVLSDLGKYDEAEALHRQAVEGREKVLGPEHPKTLESVKALGSVLYRLGKYDEAEAMHRRELGIEEKLLGPEHPDTLSSINDLGSALFKLGKYDEAESMYRRALEIREKVLGPEHSDTLITVNNLGSVLYHLEKYDEAETMLRRALESKEKP